MESIAQFQDHYSLVFNHARKTLTQILIEGLIMVQPPEARPDKDDEAGSGLAQSLEFSNRSSIILRRSPVLSVFFEKRHRDAIGKEIEGKPATLSGLMAVSQHAGPALASWLANEADRRRFKQTTAAYGRTTGVF